MPKSTKEKNTIFYYDQHAHDWATAYHGYESESYWKEEITRFQKLLPSGAILEIGSGTGKDAAALIKRGYKYTGTDASRGLIDIAQKRNPGATFINVAVNGLDFPPDSFDGFWTAATLLHIPKNQIDSALQSIRKVVKPGGVGFISLKAGAGERTDPETGRWFAYYSQKGFADVLQRNGYEIVSQKTRRDGKTYWLVYYVKKAD